MLGNGILKLGKPTVLRCSGSGRWRLEYLVVQYSVCISKITKCIKKYEALEEGNTSHDIYTYCRINRFHEGLIFMDFMNLKPRWNSQFIPFNVQKPYPQN